MIKGLLGLLGLFLALAVIGCSGPQDDWGNDHLTLDELHILDENDLWVERFSLPTEPVPCSFATCQNVVGGRTYEVLGDVGQARAEVLRQLTQRWEPTSEADSLTADSIDFQLSDDVAIDTTSRTAFLTVRFVEDAQVWQDEFVDDAIFLTYTSDVDPEWFLDEVLNPANVFSPPGLLVLASIGAPLGLTMVVWKKRVRKRSSIKER